MKPIPFRLSCLADWRRVVDFVRGLQWKRAKLDRNGQAIFDDSGKAVMEGIQYRVTIEELKPKRSLEQNARYWALLTEISKQAPSHMGGEWHSPDTWHMYCRRRFLGVEPGPFGEGVPKSTAKLGIGAFGDYMTEIEAWAVDTFAGFSFEYQEAA